MKEGKHILNIIFMGTPDIAVISLKALLKNKYDIISVYTAPDKPRGRGYKIEESPVKKLAKEYNLEIHQPSTLKKLEEIELIEHFNPDLIVVLAYGKILPKSILSIPKYGAINIHGSLLPKYRGAGPIQWSIINGEKYAGVTSMFMDEGLDTGDIILQDKMLIDPNETSGELMERIAPLAAKVLLKTIKLIEAQTVIRIPQDGTKATFAPVLDKSLSAIRFNKSALEIHNLIRGLNPWPGARISYQGRFLKIYKTKIITQNNIFGTPGTLIDNKKFILACEEGSIELLEIQLPGKRKISGKDFLLGYNVKIGEIFL